MTASDTRRFDLWGETNGVFERHNQLTRSSALHNGLPPDPVGAYSYVLDAIVSGSADIEVTRHEYAHRIFAAGGVSTDFTLYRGLTGITHSLLSTVLESVDRSGTVLHGTTLQDIEASGDNSTEINDTLKRINYVETLSEMIHRNLEPVAEIAAIDYGSASDPTFNAMNPFVRPTDFDPIEHSKNESPKIQKLADIYPAEYGGYHLLFGSFSIALNEAWSEYSQLTSERLRKELLRSVMSSVGHDDTGQLVLRDPIRMLIEISHSVNAKQVGVQDRLADQLFLDRQLQLEQVINIIHGIGRRVLPERMTTRSQAALELVTVLEESVLVSMRETAPSPSLLAYYGSNVGAGSWYSFLRFEQRRLQLNHNVLENVSLGKVTARGALEDSWWRDLLLLETVRQGLLDGGPVYCPLSGSLDLSEMELSCPGSSCVIRNGLEALSASTSLVGLDPLCDDRF